MIDVMYLLPRPFAGQLLATYRIMCELFMYGACTILPEVTNSAGNLPSMR